jgi:surface protein
LGEAFVKNNNNNCIFIYDNKGYPLEEFFDAEKIINKNDVLVIKLKRTGEMTNLSDMFNNCESLKSLPDICNFNTSNVINMSGMFRGCTSLCEMSDISKWDTSNVKDMSEMFHSCISLTVLWFSFENYEKKWKN